MRQHRHLRFDYMRYSLSATQAVAWRPQFPPPSSRRLIRSAGRGFTCQSLESGQETLPPWTPHMKG